MNPEKARQLTHEAREGARNGRGTVADVLLGPLALVPEDARRCLQEAGVAAVFTSPAEASVDWRSLPIEDARARRCALVRRGDGTTWLAMADPFDETACRKLSRLLGHPLRPAAATQSALEAWFLQAEGGVFDRSVKAEQPQELSDSPVVRFVDAALRDGYERGASDIHFECDRDGVTVKHRIDGVMVRHARLGGADRAEEVVSRLKVLAQLDITERRLPQDGRFRMRLGEEEGVDLRVSVMPSVHGEDAVLRLLDKAQLRARSDAVSLDALGFDAGSKEQIRDLAHLPSGMLLVTGPTGSGKTTTVYAALSEINTGLEKIITIEDPVEYELPGVLQIPVNERKGLTFARGLRSILRHDPDRILVGEIRDAETAEIAVQSALTGHLVFTTVHANSLSDVIGRFRHFDIDVFGFMSALNGVVVQRLIRRVCPHCRGTRALTSKEEGWFRGLLAEAPGSVPASRGCDRCRGTGYSGRFVVAEVHAIEDGFRDLVTGNASLTALKDYTRQVGVVSLQEAAAQQVARGSTTVEEVRRVVGWI